MQQTENSSNTVHINQTMSIIIWNVIIKKWNIAIDNNIEGSRGYYAKRNKSDVERQIPYDFTSVQSKKKVNEQTKQAHMQRTIW